ncbi:MAG: MG2 domain-containing protein, partial [Ignavibacteriaceae bacterium]
MPELSAGWYLILVATDPEFTYIKNAVGYSKTWVSNISYVRRDMNDKKVQFYVMNRESGEPLSNVSVEVFVQTYNQDAREYRFIKVEDGKTNSEGLFEFNKKENNYNNYKVIFKNDNDRFESQNYYSYYRQNEPTRRLTTFFYLDRAIYRPGQIVYFKGLIIDTDGKKDNKIVPDKQTTVTFYDANHQKITDATFTTNEDGTFNGKFTIPVGKI